MVVRLQSSIVEIFYSITSVLMQFLFHQSSFLKLLGLAHHYHHHVACPVIDVAVPTSVQD